ncbi:DinB family protein [Staphylococcus sp. SQ8-PEA]|uniref:DinB family protein n=1 Tax=Staphylococcus marylandisciuri TaxID=2981529 RepID=A0ABT2QQA9_9STAP|nr:DinB family protein [Staphylococcus marylandisciuri]MCU5746170.1 DinB family protein [Staphylococcus marylandisciuri]
MIREQIETTYKLLKQHITNIDEEKAIFQPEIANNNIKWQLGHIILLNDFLFFEKVNGENALKQTISKYFLWGTSPKDFDGNEPSFKELKVLLGNQFDTILNILDDQVEAERDEPIMLKNINLRMDTFEQSIHFAMLHINRHFGQIVMLKSMIENVK